MSDIPVVPSLEMNPPEPVEAMRANPPRWRWWHVLLMAAGIIAAQIVGAMAGFTVIMLTEGIGPQQLMRMSEEGMAALLAAPLFVLVYIGVQELGMFLAVWLLGMLPKRLSFREVGFRSTAAMWILLGAGLALPLIVLRGALAYAIVEALNIDISNLEQMSEMITSGTDPATIAGTLILVSLVVPFVEELFFRGVVFKWLRGKLGLWASAILSGLIFGIFHLDPVQGFSTWILGIACAWMYEKSGSLWPALAMHLVTNLVAQGGAYMVLWLQP